jgi:Putative phage tail protein
LLFGLITKILRSIMHQPDILSTEFEMPTEIYGAGFGGKGGGGGGSEAPNSARSRAYANVLLALSEGEIQGFPVGQDIRKFVYFDETVLMNPDGTLNFKNVAVEFRSGTQAQAPVAGADRGVFNSSSIGVRVTASGGAVTRSISSSSATSLRISLTTPGLRSFDSNGNINGSVVAFTIALSTNGGAFVNKITDTFDFKTAGGYARDYTIKVPPNPSANWQVRITRLTPDSTSDKVQNDLVWQSTTAITERQLRYPNTALLFVRFDAAYFRQIPRISVKLQGLICRVPSNYDPATRAYTGIWNGTWQLRYTDNPAWILMEFLTNKRFGCGDYINTDQIDKGSLYKISKRCDELVSNGSGGTEPRYTLSEYFKQGQDAWPFIQQILSAINCLAYYSGGQIVFFQDAPGQPIGDLYTQANTVTVYGDDGRMTQPPFRYERTSQQAVHTVALVKWADSNDFDRIKTEYVDLAMLGRPADLRRLGYRPIELNPTGCTSKAQALRYGRHSLATELLQKEIVYFGAGSQGALRTPGDIIRLQDNHRSRNRFGGRVKGATANTIELDAPVDITTASTTISVLIDEIEVTRTVNNPIGSHSVLQVFPALATLPTVGAIWIVSTPKPPKLYQVLSISEDRDSGSYGMAAAQYSEEKWVLVDQSGVLPASLATARSIPNPPTNLEILTRPDGYFVGWKPSDSASVVAYNLERAEEGTNNWQPIPVRPGASDAEVLAPTYAPTRFRVNSLDIYGRSSAWVESAANYQKFGYIAERLGDGSVRLDRFVELIAGTTYYLRTAEEQNGQIVYNSRAVTNGPGITKDIMVTPNFQSSGVTYGPGIYSNLGGQDSRIGYIEITGTVTAPVSYQDYDGVFVGDYYGVVLADTPQLTSYSFAGRHQVLTAGVYRSESLHFNFLIRSIAVPQGMSVFAAERQTRVNPVPGSAWELRTSP